MGKIAFSLADKVFVTSDNPRTEEPQKIIEQIISPLPSGSAKIFTEVDRKTAIGKAIAAMKADDVLIIAGKGHEQYQVLGNETIHFSDREIASSFLKTMS